MATQRIINGPPRWDIMLSFFEAKPITFTLEGGRILKVSNLLCMWNMYGYDPLVGVVNQKDKDIGPGMAEAYLLRGFCDTFIDDGQAFIEYRMRSRQGLCIVLGMDDLCDDPVFLPDHWSKIMGLEDGNYHD